jgi:hypothetical protein
MDSLIAKISRWLALFRKTASGFVDLFKPRGYVEARLIWAEGPKKGQVYKVLKGKNVVTSWLSADGAAPTSGRDLMRRILVPDGFSGSLAGTSTAVIGQMALGSGTTAEVSSDTDLDNEIGGSMKSITAVTFDGTNPYVTFTCEWTTGEVNQTITEAGLFSNRQDGSGNYDFIARKTFGAFTKTSQFTLQILWQIRF